MQKTQKNRKIEKILLNSQFVRSFFCRGVLNFWFLNQKTVGATSVGVIEIHITWVILHSVNFARGSNDFVGYRIRHDVAFIFSNFSLVRKSVLTVLKLNRYPINEIPFPCKKIGKIATQWHLVISNTLRVNRGLWSIFPIRFSLGLGCYPNLIISIL